jgi:AraC-like DNA-binding protein
MPLYMDIHTVESNDFSVEDVVTAHMQDVAVQEKFGVLQIKYWVDTENKKIFCLMEGPSKEACNAVHLESHGNTACNIIEVSDDEYNLFLNSGRTKDDLAQTIANEVDPGFRTFILINTYDFTNRFNHYTNQIYQILEQYNGINIAQVNSGILSYFNDASNAVTCGIAIENILKKIPDNYEYRLTIVTGDPVDENGNKLYEETKNKINTISQLGLNFKIYMDDITASIIQKSPKAPKINSKLFNVIDANDLLLLKKIQKIFEGQLNKPDFNLKKFNTALGLSKAQSYRKIKHITGLAPNQLFQEMRMRQSLRMLKRNTKTVAEIAYDLGFNSPTYFTRVFKKRFKTLPSSIRLV